MNEEGHVETETSNLPLISCIMPTKGRKAFVGRAIKLFQAQAYPNKELIIVDEHECYGSLIVFPQTIARDVHNVLLAGDTSGLTIGKKRNMACSFAQGEIICHWDDDDYFDRTRLYRQVEPLLSGYDVSAMKMMLILHVPTMALWRISEEERARLFAHDVRSGTLMYWRGYWQDGLRYQDRSRGEDVDYLNGLIEHGARLAQVTSYSSYICVRHDSNVSADMEYENNPHFQRVAIEDYLSIEDRAFYASMQGEKVAA